MARVAAGAACSIPTSPEFGKEKRPKPYNLSGRSVRPRTGALMYGNANCMNTTRLCEAVLPGAPLVSSPAKLQCCSRPSFSAGQIWSPCRQLQVPVEHLLEVFRDKSGTSSARHSRSSCGAASPLLVRMENPSVKEVGGGGGGRKNLTGKPAVLQQSSLKASFASTTANRGLARGSRDRPLGGWVRAQNEGQHSRLGDSSSSSSVPPFQIPKALESRRPMRLHVAKPGNLNGVPVQSPSSVLEVEAPPSRVIVAQSTTVLAPGEEDRAAKCAHVPLQATPSEPPPLLRMHPDALQYEEGVLGAISDKTAPPPDDECLVDPSCSAMGYLRRILTSRVYDVAIESPLELAPKLSESVGTPIHLKREDMQQVFSFKLRGAYNMMAQLPRESLERGVIASSAGNHAQGVALSARKLGCTAIIAMPVTTPDIKWRSVQRLGAEVVLVGDSYDETQTYAKRRAVEEGLVFIPPFDDPDVIAGQGTVGMEILRQHPGPLHAIFVPVGGGGLIAGIAAYVKRLRPEVRVIGVEPVDANAMALSLQAGQRVMLEQVGGFADGVAVRTVGEETFRIARELVDGIVLVTRDSICAAIKDMFEETRSILEPAGALALAGAKAYCRQYGLEGESVVAVTSGANMNFDRLRLVTDLANVGLRREAVLATTLPERPGAFKHFCQTVGMDLNITEFKYRYAHDRSAHVLYSVGLHRDEAVTQLMERMEAAGMPTLDMTTNDLAKDHLRHLVGGRTSAANEVLYRFVFPERPGALMKFLDMLSPRWNITLFHYRGQGEMGANVLVGIQVPPEEEDEFRLAADSLGYSYQDERANEAFLMFMR